MNKLVYILLIFSTFQLHAQYKCVDPTIGVFVGTAITGITGPSNNRNSNGKYLGLNFEQSMGERISVLTELGWLRYKLRHDSGYFDTSILPPHEGLKVNDRYDNIEVSFGAKYYIRIRRVSYYLRAGINIHGNVHKQRNFEIYNGNDFTVTEYEDLTVDDTDEYGIFVPFGIGGTVGFGLSYYVDRNINFYFSPFGKLQFNSPVEGAMPILGTSEKFRFYAVGVMAGVFYRLPKY